MSAMQNRTTIVRQLVTSEGPVLADRIDAKIRTAEQALAISQRELEHAVVAEAQAKDRHADFRKLTLRIKNLAPLIREEVISLERIWRSATEKRLRLKDTLDLAEKEVASACLAREQLKEIGLYLPSL
jgi:hypothetical protein